MITKPSARRVRYQGDGGCLLISGASYKNNPLMDERMKPGYPDELFPREDIVKTVETRWNPYFGK
ncbi:hypothetical protein [Paenibacillus sp. FSL W7-1332]|uniref:hypothetical protein n=1 Tax=Paenibacillus sp. FSL W7-1332 TaxID=2921702 RepID=UPI0030D050C6